MDIIEKLEEIKRRYMEVSELIVLPDIISDNKRYGLLMKEYKNLGKIVALFDKYTQSINDISGAKEMLGAEKDPEFREMAKMELEEAENKKVELEEAIKIALIPKDPNDEKNCLLEIRAGAGGDEAALFCGELMRMYQRYAEDKKWSFTITDSVEGSAGGYSKIIAEVTGEDVYGSLKFESGVHRVQRVPATESQGRVHTSAVTIAVMPEAEDFDIEIDKKDIKKDTYRASGAGGQHVNKTESAVRLTHHPSGIVVECQDGRSQHKNYDSALKQLRSKLYQIELDKKNEAESSHRKSLVGNGDRADKIRTYNFPQSRVTDHRISKTSYNLDAFVNGDIEDYIDALRIADNTAKMKEERV